MNQNTYKGQILLITILVLMIIGIIVVGVINLANRDVQQTISEQQYQQILNVSEVSLLEYVNLYGSNPGSFLDLSQDQPQCILLSQTEIECPLDLSADGVDTLLKMEDLNEIDDFELTKDESFEVDLISDPTLGKGFRGEIIFGYTGNVALEFALIYTYQGEVEVVSDIFDVTGGQVLDLLQGDPLDNSDTKHPFNFQPEIAAGDYSFLINDIDGFPADAEPRSLRITARMSPGDSVTLLDLEANLGGLSQATAGFFPPQVRRYIAESYFVGDDANIATRVITQVPLLPQAASFLHSGFLTPGNVSK